MVFSTDNRPVAILVVEDEVMVRMIATDILADEGFRVIEARDAKEALTLLEARTDVRVVFTDCNMPGEIDGIGLAHLVHRRWPQIGIIVTSGRVRPAPGDLPQGARFVAKPYRRSTLLDEVRELLGLDEGTPQGAPVLPESVVVQPPVSGTSGVAHAAPVPEPDKS
ncbi:response regulator [Methylobacterium oxalidis]|uniref:response regulator n=1 Tax=Methylobacterium oxalidis TaxID=944322 RepID=UPI003314F553